MSLYEKIKEAELKENLPLKNKKENNKFNAKEKTLKNEDKIIVGKYSDAPE